jgi:hypothetical protein
MVFAVVGDVGEKAETKIYIGDFDTQSAEVVRLLTANRLE